MKIQVTGGSTRDGNFGYVISVAQRDANGHASKENVERLMSLKSRIQNQANRQLGSAFSGIDEVGPLLVLQVKCGTSSNDETKFILRSLLGWVEIFDDEPPAG
jgi:hypothetical protein